MTKNEIFETMCAGYLNDRYRIWLNMGERDADWTVYEGGLKMLTAFGCEWRRNGDGIHSVYFLSAEDAKRLNIHLYD